MNIKITTFKMHRYTTFVVILLVCASGVLSKPSSEDQYESQTRLASKADEQRPALHKVHLTATDLHRFGLIPSQKNKNSVPQIINYDDNTEKVNNIDQLKRKRDLEDILSGRDIKEDQIYEDNNVVGNINRRKRNLEQILDRKDEEERNKRNVALIPNQEQTKTNLEVDDMINEGVTDEMKERKKRDHYWFGIGGGTNLYNPPINSYQYHSVPNIPPWNLFSGFSIPSTQSYQAAYPFFGSQLPIYFPIKSILFNPGYPTYNRPERPLFPVLPRENDTNIPVDIPPRFGDPNDDKGLEQHPVWGIVGESEEASSGGTATTRRPTQTYRPPPTTARPATTTAGPKQLGRCTWAIITCCSPKDDKIKYNCFENAGCEGSFWGSNPCSRETTLEALEAVQQFYASQ